MSVPRYGDQCDSCRHLRRNVTAVVGNEKPPRQVPTCVAFPDGIPWPITTGEHDHRNPFPGDGGTTYEPRPPG